MKLFTCFISMLMCHIFLVEAHEHHHHHDHDEEHFQWTSEKSVYADIQTAVAGPGTIQKFTLASGKITTHPDHFAYVIPKVAGTVCAIRKNLGDFVANGEVVAVVESKHIAEAKSHYLLACSKTSARQEIVKKESLLRGISPEQDYLAAKLAYEEARIECECAIQSLYALGFTDKEIEQIHAEGPAARRFYTLKSPLKGKILSRNLTLGEATTETTPAFTIGNFDKVWVEVHVNQDDVRYIKEGLPIEITSAGGKKASVSVCQFNPMISEETRMATALAVLDNPLEQWIPGQYIHAAIATKSFELPIVVSKEAVQKMKGKHYIFVQCSDNFEPCQVELGKMDESHVEIISGLMVGDCYVTDHAFCLKADYEKEEVEHNH